MYIHIQLERRDTSWQKVIFGITVFSEKISSNATSPSGKDNGLSETEKTFCSESGYKWNMNLFFGSSDS